MKLPQFLMNIRDENRKIAWPYKLRGKDITLAQNNKKY